MKGWGESASTVCVGKNTGNCIQYFITLVLFTFCTCCILRCLVCTVVILCIFAVLCVYCCFFTLDARLLARSQYSEGPATGLFDTGFSCFPCIYKQMLRWFPRFQVATTCFSRSPPDLNLLVITFIFYIHVK